MDEYVTADMFLNDDRTDQSSQHGSQASDQPAPPASRGLRTITDAVKGKSSLQDRLLDKLLEQFIPGDENGDSPFVDGATLGDDVPSYERRPNFNITTMSNNFRRFNARIGVMFKFQIRVQRLLTWRKPSQTLSLLAVYTFICLDPYLLSVLPLAALLLSIIIPSFITRHPAPPHGSQSSDEAMGYSPRGPPLAPAPTVKPVKELSRDFFRNMRDLQNSMDDFSVLHDKVVDSVVPLTNFSNESLSSALFIMTLFGCVIMTISAHLLPWRFLFLAGGWAAICIGHPAAARMFASTENRERLQDQEARTRTQVDNWITKDIILDSAPETREVEIFELQRLSSAGEWEAWLFSPSPFDPLSQPRIAGERPRGTRFFEDVLAPDGWEWSEKKWALDLLSREWVEERIITGVEVETEGERWVYDIATEQENPEDADEPNGSAAPGRTRSRLAVPQPSWEEGFGDGEGRRGEWRRRRWVRLVKRKKIAGTT